jgi:hypothetical protein
MDDRVIWPDSAGLGMYGNCVASEDKRGQGPEGK